MADVRKTQPVDPMAGTCCNTNPNSGSCDRSDTNVTEELVVRDTNEDPITGEHGAHPVGVGAGTALGGAMAGAAAGALGGPIGAVAGAVIGGVAGGYVGKAAAEAIDPTVEDAYWRENYLERPYVTENVAYDEYRPAYQYGWESRGRYPERAYDDVESDLQSDWERRPVTTMEWEEARPAIRDAWEHVDQGVRRPR